jgi:cytochrome c556
MRRPSKVVWLLRAVVCLTAACGTGRPGGPPQQAQLVNAISPPARLEPPEYLPGAARAVLRTRMASHAREMGTLVSAIMVLRYAEIEERSNAIAHDTRFARPLTGDATELNSALPEKFFDYERELRVWAGALTTAAEKTDPFAVATAYGELSQVCVKCHATYRQGR